MWTSPVMGLVPCPESRQHPSPAHLAPSSFQVSEQLLVVCVPNNMNWRWHKPAANTSTLLPPAMPRMAARRCILHLELHLCISPFGKQLPCTHFQCFLFVFILSLKSESKEENPGAPGEHTASTHQAATCLQASEH